jgi:SAM-dependent methyltransferase
MQRPYIARDPALRRAARKGVAVWRDYYGELLYEDLRWWVGEKGLTRSACRILRDLMLRCPRKLTAHLLAAAVRRTKRMLACARQRCSAVRRVDFGEFRRLTPFSRQFGFDRGQPLDRYYIEQFLESEAKHIRGAVLEIGDASYTRRFGAERVSSSDVLDLVPGAPGATITADLTGSDLPPDSFDCIILTQTLHFIFDLPGAIKNVFRMLRPAGCLLVTAPGISQICRDQTDRESDSWRFTASSASRLFAEDFGEQNISVASYGNVLAATAFLYGLPVSGMKQSELAFTDPDYPLIISVKAVKARQSL